MVCGKRKLVVTSSRRLHRQRKAKAQRPPPRSTFLFPPRPEWRHESFRRPAFQQLTGRKDKREFVPTFFLSFVRSFFPSTARWWPGLPAVPVYTSESARTRARATSRTPRSRRSDFQRARIHARYVATDTQIWATVSRARGRRKVRSDGNRVRAETNDFFLFRFVLSARKHWLCGDLWLRERSRRFGEAKVPRCVLNANPAITRYPLTRRLHETFR